jgi:hypothetical protein
MKNQIARNLVLAAMLFGGAAFTSQAQVTIFSDNLDSQPLGPAPGYFYADAANVSYSFVAGVGVGGSEAAVVTTDFTSGPNWYGGAAFVYQQDGQATGNTSANLSDYTLSFDAEVNAAGGGFQFIVETFSGAIIPANMSGHGIISPNITLGTANVFQHFSYNLSQLVLDPYGMQTLPITTDPSWQLGFQIQEWTGPWVNGTTGAQIVIDNIELTMVPEPSTLAMLAVGSVGIFGWRRISRRA